MERKLASIQKVAEIKPIEGADAIEAVRVNGWWVVAKKGEYSVNDFCVYVEIDSFVPNSVAPFLTKSGHLPKVFNEVPGERLRTIRLRGQLSQGLLLPIGILPRSLGFEFGCVEGEDVTHWLGIQKWERPLPAALAGLAKGNFPTFIPKTDQERIQNLNRSLEKWVKEDWQWEVTEKLDGSSMTVYVNHNELDEEGAPKHGVCSRNLDLIQDASNSFWEAAVRYELIEKLKNTGRSLAIQGELVGEGIQGDSYKLSPRKFYCFDIFDIDTRQYLLPHVRREICKDLGIEHVPVISERFRFDTETSVSSLLALAEGKSLVGAKPEREGLVFKSTSEHDVSFKCVSNRWLEKGGE